MKHALALTAFYLTLTGPTLAQTAMSGAEFEAYVTGKTLFFEADGQRYGVEEYLPNRRVRWSFLDGQCKEGAWFEDGAQICFVYEDNPSPQCWSFYQGNGGLTAKFENEAEGQVLYEIDPSGEEMLCLGPEVGV
ncbi:hypothetical protein J7413_12500 [Shimia sp. R10_1]|uniref:hypothetical protein n=1 Tax=Shimia sp. R10_1 TaxID=2821095 RepID=UPI001AD96DA4|nr:hypothetical protein [Shimia sp. R10_1]MBO9474362.1 hypothetical protein [Shimia sp. R10_1]